MAQKSDRDIRRQQRPEPPPFEVLTNWLPDAAKHNSMYIYVCIYTCNYKCPKFSDRLGLPAFPGHYGLVWYRWCISNSGQLQIQRWKRLEWMNLINVIQVLKMAERLLKFASTSPDDCQLAFCVSKAASSLSGTCFHRAWNLGFLGSRDVVDIFCIFCPCLFGTDTIPL